MALELQKESRMMSQNVYAERGGIYYFTSPMWIKLFIYFIYSIQQNLKLSPF